MSKSVLREDVERAAQINVLRQNGALAKTACSQFEMPPWKYYATNNWMVKTGHKDAFQPTVGKNSPKKKIKKKKASTSQSATPKSTTNKHPRFIEEAIKNETNAFIQSLDDRIDKAMNQAVLRINRHYKIS
jgi:hypothetical protein